jgi:cysteine desulfuration protein SufE
MVHECQAPVFLKVHIETDSLHVYADVPREAPIARGFVSILVLAFHGRSLTSLDPLPDDLLVTLGLRGLLGMQRTHGLSAIYNHLKEAVAG